jgi:hypothetical protein
LPHFFGGAKKRVGRRDEHPATPYGSERCNTSSVRKQQQWRLALARCHCNGNVKGNDPLPTRVTLRYTRCASTQGERVKGAAAGHGKGKGNGNGNGNGNRNRNHRCAERQQQRSLRATSNAN